MNKDDECPNCHNGTLGDNGEEFVCRGECGAIFKKDGIFKLEWGISPNRPVAICWGARAIYGGPGMIDLLFDRQSCKGGTREQCQQFAQWLNKYGIPAIKKLTRDESLYGGEDRQLSLCLDDWFIVINPRSSCGYLYIGVYPQDNGDPNFVPAPKR